MTPTSSWLQSLGVPVWATVNLLSAESYLWTSRRAWQAKRTSCISRPHAERRTRAKRTPASSHFSMGQLQHRNQYIVVIIDEFGIIRDSVSVTGKYTHDTILLMQ